ncbi:FG-GAP repeat protein [Streptomyces sp. WAC01526]|uniref:FG-GAP repeat protein n=1 Tax=Streptomyces sp. WAC01526 TaxID=2588709 RepID=UPI0011E0236B|nr:FG-GAP repeat protein [Streptomyces sp. WAC01526]
MLYGSAHGVDASRHTTVSQNSPGIPGAGGAGDLFGGEVFLSDLNGDKKADLTVGAVYEDGGNGALTTLPSDGTRLTATGSRFLSPPQSAFPPRAPRSWAASWRGEGEACAFHGVELRFLGRLYRAAFVGRF